MKKTMLLLLMSFCVMTATAQQVQVSVNGGYEIEKKLGRAVVEGCYDFGRIITGLRVSMGEECAYHLVAKAPFTVFYPFRVYGGIILGATNYEIGAKQNGHQKSSFSFSLGWVQGLELKITRGLYAFAELDAGCVTRLAEARCGIGAGLRYVLK